MYLQSFNLIKGYTHWASGRISQIEVNLESPLLYCHVHLTMHDPFDEARQLSPMTVAGKEWNQLLEKQYTRDMLCTLLSLFPSLLSLFVYFLYCHLYFNYQFILMLVILAI